MFASHTTAKLNFTDGSEAVIVTIRKLNAEALRRASEEQSTRAMAMAAKAGPELLALWTKDGAPAARADADQLGTRYRQYDRPTVLLAGVESWTAKMELAKGLGDLDEETAEALHRAILDLSLPPIDKEAAAARRGES